MFKAKIKVSFINKYYQYKNDSFNIFYQKLYKNKLIEVLKEALKVLLSYIQALFKDRALKPLKTLIILSLIIKELNNKAEVKAETKIAKGTTEAFKRINRRN